MKIRTNYVSNSSSSSFIVKDITNILSVITLIWKYIEDMQIDEQYRDYGCTKDGIKAVFDKKFKQSKQDNNDLIDIYINNEFYDLFSDLFYLNVYTRDFELSGCTNCEFYTEDCEHWNSKECKSCSNKYTYKRIMDCVSNVASSCSNFDEFDFEKEKEEIKEYVYSLPTKQLYNNEIVVDVEKSNEAFILKLVDKYTKLWKQKYPNSFVFSFASDVGDYNEAYLRSKVFDLASFMYNNKIDCLIGENS